ncbi:MAG: phosphoglucosamine mutase [Flavobacteriaceae bacterium]
MTLIKSISGFRGTIGGAPEDNLTPLDAVRFTAAYATLLQQQFPEKCAVVLGRDARISGPMLYEVVAQTLIGMGVDVIDLGLSTTPTVEMAVVFEQAQAGIILTASHNPKEWNALKLLNEAGEFISAETGKTLLDLVEKDAYVFAEVDHLGSRRCAENALENHIDAILALEWVDVQAIAAQNFKVVVDGVNSSGGIAVPQLLDALGVSTVPLYCEPTGHFPHNPEPLEEHLTDLRELVVAQGADFGIVVDPDVDRLAFVDENGKMFGEEYTLVACADYVLSQKPGNTVSNLSSTKALSDITQKYKGKYFASAVGELNVVQMMKAQGAVIGGEGNGGVILPELHYGRDALVGIALFLSHLAKNPQKVSELRASYPDYFMAKLKVNLAAGMDVDGILERIRQNYSNQNPLTVDGVKIPFENSWVHLRKSNTEPIIRVYTEAPSAAEAQALGNRFVQELEALSKS